MVVVRSPKSCGELLGRERGPDIGMGGWKAGPRTVGIPSGRKWSTGYLRVGKTLRHSILNDHISRCGFLSEEISLNSCRNMQP